MNHAFSDMVRYNKTLSKPRPTSVNSEHIVRTTAVAHVVDVSLAQKVSTQCGRMDHMISRIDPNSTASVDFLKREAQHTIEQLQLYIRQLETMPLEA